MKTMVKSLLALTLTGILLTGTIFNSNAETVVQQSTETPGPLKTFNMIVVSGNVKVTLVQSSKQHISVNSEYDSSSASFKQKGYTLYINSDKAAPLEVTVYVNDLRRIDASNGAEVTTSGAFNQDVMQIFLNDDAKAQVKGKIRSLYTVTNGNSKLKLIGTADEHILVKNELSGLNIENFAALKTEATTLNTDLAAAVKLVLMK